MADTTKSLEILVKLRDEFSAGIKNVNRELSKMGGITNIANKAFTGLKTGIQNVKSQIFSLQGAFATIGVGLITKSFIDSAREAENFRLRLNALLGSAEEGNRVFKDMAEFAAKVPFAYQDIMGAATQLSGIMKGGVDEINRWMPLIADLAAVSGLGIQTTTEQIVRMYSAGAASADLFRERGILAMLGFQAGVSYSAEETKKRLIEAWEDPLSKFRGATNEMAKSWDGLMSMIGDKWNQFKNLIMDAGVYDALKQGLSAINEHFGEWIKNNEVLIRQKIPEYVKQVQSAVSELWDQGSKIYNLFKSLPDDIIGIAGYGILGRILWGGPKGFLLAAFAVGKSIANLYNETMYGVKTLQSQLEEDLEETKQLIAEASTWPQTEKNLDYFDRLNTKLKLITDKLEILKDEQKEISFQLPLDEFTSGLPTGETTPTRRTTPTAIDEKERARLAKIEDEDFRRRLDRYKSEEDAIKEHLITKAELEEQAALDEIAAIEKLESDKAAAEEDARQRRLEINQRYANELAKIKDKEREVWEKLTTHISEAFTNSFIAMVEGTETFSKAFHRMVLSILSDYAQLIMRKGINELLNIGISALSNYILSAGMNTGAPVHVGAGGTTAFGMAIGGEIPGSSPHSKADNVLIRATAGEYMHPVDTVKYYGGQVMEAIRSKMIPREFFSGFRMPSIPSVPRSRFAYATGGAVSGGGSNIKVEMINESPTPLESTGSDIEIRGDEMIVKVMIDAMKRNVGGSRDQMKGILG